MSDPSARTWPDIVGRVCDLLAVRDGEPVNLLEDIAHMDCSRRRAAIDDLPAMRTQVVRRDLREEPIAPYRKQFPFEDRAPHGPRAVGHRRINEPLLPEFTEALGFFKPPLLALLLNRRRPPFADGSPCIDAEFASAGE